MGLATGLDEWNNGTANIQLVVGVSWVFGIGGGSFECRSTPIRGSGSTQ